MVKYQRIADSIRDDILQGKYRPGQQLALEKEMCKAYGVSRITVKRAVDELVSAGLVVKRRGSGTFVKSMEADAAKRASEAKRFASFSERFAGRDIQTSILQFNIVNPTQEVAVKLRMPTEDFIYDIARLRTVDGVPLSIEYAKLPIQLVPGIKRETLESSLYHYIEQELHMHIQSAHRMVRAVPPAKEEQKLLGITASQPILEITQMAFLDDGRPFEYAVLHERGDQCDFRAVSIR